MNTYVRPILNYSSPIWSPHFLKDISSIERVQRSFTKRIPAIRNLPFSDRLLYLHNKSIQHRKFYYDLVLMYNIVHGFSAVKLNDIVYRHCQIGRGTVMVLVLLPVRLYQIQVYIILLTGREVVDYVIGKRFINVITSN